MSINACKIFIILISSTINNISGQSTLINRAGCTYSFVVPATEGLCNAGGNKQEVADLRHQVQLLQEMLKTINITQQLLQLNLQVTEDRFRNQVENLTNELDKVKQEAQAPSTGGAVYVHWGRTVCPESTTKVYDGVVGGSHYDQSGGGVEKLCLPTDPEWGRTTDGFQSNSYLYGAEYQIYSANDPFSTENAGSTSTIHHQDAVCAVCQTLTRPSHLMIPAKKTCPGGWTKEYDGYLMAHHYTETKTSFNCVDKAPEVRQGGGADRNGALFYNVEAACGSLPCLPYVNGWEITCVLCTK